MRYNTPNTPSDQLRDFFLRGQMPVTMTLLVANLVTFLVAFFSPTAARPLLELFGSFSTLSALSAPWTFLTFPLVSLPPISIMLILTWVFFWLSGGSLERGWGSARFAAFFFAVTLVSSLSLFAGSLLTHIPVPFLNDLFLPLTGLIVAFCMLNPEQEIMLYFFPVRARYVALIVTVWTYLNYGGALGPWLGLFALGGILAAFLYVRFARPWADIGTYSSRPRQAPRGPDLRLYPSSTPSTRFSTRPSATLDGSPRRSPLDLAGRWKDYQERKRLEKLWKNSGFADPEQSWRDDDRRR